MNIRTLPCISHMYGLAAEFCLVYVTFSGTPIIIDITTNYVNCKYELYSIHFFFTLNRFHRQCK